MEGRGVPVFMRFTDAANLRRPIFVCDPRVPGGRLCGQLAPLTVPDDEDGQRQRVITMVVTVPEVTGGVGVHPTTLLFLLAQMAVARLPDSTPATPPAVWSTAVFMAGEGEVCVLDALPLVAVVDSCVPVATQLDAVARHLLTVPPAVPPTSVATSGHAAVGRLAFRRVFDAADGRQRQALKGDPHAVAEHVRQHAAGGVVLLRGYVGAAMTLADVDVAADDGTLTLRGVCLARGAARVVTGVPAEAAVEGLALGVGAGSARASFWTGEDVVVKLYDAACLAGAVTLDDDTGRLTVHAPGLQEPLLDGDWLTRVSASPYAPGRRLAAVLGGGLETADMCTLSSRDAVRRLLALARAQCSTDVRVARQEDADDDDDNNNNNTYNKGGAVVELARGPRADTCVLRFPRFPEAAAFSY